MRGLVVVLLVSLSMGSARADDAAQAAEQLEKEARQSGDLDQYAACGAAYLAIYNRDPDGPDNDAVLYNAGVCYSDARSTAAALSVFSLLVKYYPASRITPKAIARTGKLYVDIAFFERAAEQFEIYAKKYAGEKDAVDALSDAIYFRTALGDTVKLVEDTSYFVRTFGAKNRHEAAKAELSLLQVKAGDEAIALVRGFIRDFGNVDPDLTVRAYVELGDRLRAKSCPVKAIDGLCAKLVPDQGIHCGKNSPRLVAVARSSANRDALEAYANAVKQFEHMPHPEEMARHWGAMAKLALADDKLEAVLALPFPSNLDFEAKKKSSVERFQTWFESEQTLDRAANEAYAAVIAMRDSYASVAATARIGQTALAFRDAIMQPDLPKAVRAEPVRTDYCSQMNSSSQPLESRAIEAFSTCVAKANELAVAHDWADLCWREGERLDPEKFPPLHELRGTPHDAPVLATEPPPALRSP